MNLISASIEFLSDNITQGVFKAALTLNDVKLQPMSEDLLMNYTERLSKFTQYFHHQRLLDREGSKIYFG